MTPTLSSSFSRKKFGLLEKFKKAGIDNCFISEITLAELKFGAEYSSNPEKHRREVEVFVSVISVLPITTSINVYALEKTRLQKIGTPVDNFDLLIAATAITNGLTLVTNNVKHFDRFPQLNIEDWTKSEALI